MTSDFGSEASALDARLVRLDVRVEALERGRMQDRESLVRIETSTAAIERHLRVQNGRVDSLETRMTSAEIADGRVQGAAGVRSEISRRDLVVLGLFIGAVQIGIAVMAIGGTT